MHRPQTFLAGLSPAEFLARHFQKEPLLVRGALPGYVSPVSSEELAGLALESEVESRVVCERAGEFHLERGPFDEAFFQSLPDTHWTLLVQDLDQHVPEVGDLFDLLDLLSYRLDDVMASHAARFGSVGPHFDQYDVFLLQVSGRRRWQISRDFDRSKVVSDSELCILSEFLPSDEWVLDPGDLLYLPPGVAHHGVALDPCMTFSLGCRAPSVSEIVTHVVQGVLDSHGEDTRYRDPDLTPTVARYELDADAIARAGRLLEQHLRFEPDAVARALASLLTQPKALFARDDGDFVESAAVRRALSGDRSLFRRKGSRWLLCPLRDGLSLFVDGAEWRTSSAVRSLAVLLSEERELDSARVREWLEDAEGRALLAQLVESGLLETDG